MLAHAQIRDRMCDEVRVRRKPRTDRAERRLSPSSADLRHVSFEAKFLETAGKICVNVYIKVWPFLLSVALFAILQYGFIQLFDIKKNSS